MRATRTTTRMAVGLALLAGALWAAPATPPADKEKIARLVDQLESNSPRERESAMEQLEAVGEPALPRLRESAKSMHPRAAARAEKVIEAIGRKSRDARLLAPTMVELNLDNATVDEALAELSKQSGYEVVRAKSVKGDRRVTLKTGRMPFLRALEMFQERAGMVQKELVDRFSLPDDIGFEAKLLRRLDWKLPPDFDPKHLDPVALPTSELPNPYSTIEMKEGAFTRPNGRIDGAIRVRVGPSFLSAPDAARAGHPMFLRVDSELKVSIVGVSGVSIDRAIDDRGQNRTRLFAGTEETPIPLWSPESTSAVRSLRHIEDRITNLSRTIEPRFVPLTLNPAALAASSLRELSGAVRIYVEFPLCTVAEVADLSDSAARNTIYKNGDPLSVEKFVRNPNGTFTVAANRSIVSDDPDDLYWLHTMFGPAELEVEGKRRKIDRFGESFHLYDDRGREMKQVGLGGITHSTEGQKRNMITTRTYRPNDPSTKPARLVVSGSSVETIEVPFVLKDVPIRE